MYLCTRILCRRFGKNFSELEPHQRVQVGGSLGGSLTGGQLAHPEAAPPAPEVRLRLGMRGCIVHAVGVLVGSAIGS